ncbi:hypothetical protein [Ruminiclostridium papyrosolvens]|uniref:DUF3899 domain-containing protein n=1 Tax=Ruminiclostridium papyrosolvens C7 TaxID=1330534 RepID=U4R511_9FIRM|nr:hypothetical protein [Ruminiclostridium papyrosolvens]EPR13002.1 hypothetical protein L323_06890 [Ruminiclostridium papyrosolvens C7]
MKPIEILSLVLMAIGFISVYMAKTIVRKFDLAKKQTCEHEAEMTEQEVEEYKFNKAVFNIKMSGFLVATPGIALLIIFR